MALYDFHCKKCNQDYDAFAPYDETGKYPSVKCPQCVSKRKLKTVSRGFAFSFTDPVGTDRWHSDATGHDYRFKYNLPKVRMEREFAEKFSHMGPNPYEEILSDQNLDEGIHHPETRPGLS